MVHSFAARDDKEVTLTNPKGRTRSVVMAATVFDKSAFIASAEEGDLDACIGMIGEKAAVSSRLSTPSLPPPH